MFRCPQRCSVSNERGASSLTILSSLTTLSSSAAKSYAYKGIPLSGFNRRATSRTDILNNPTGVGIEGVTATTPAPSDNAIALVSYGANLAQNEQTGDLGMYFGMGNLDDVKMPGEQRCT